MKTNKECFVPTYWDGTLESRYKVDFNIIIYKRNKLGRLFILIDSKKLKIISKQFISVNTMMNEKFIERIKKFFRYKIELYENEVNNER